MNITSVNSSLFARNQQSAPGSTSLNTKTSFADLFNTAQSEQIRSSDTASPDFSNMSRKDLFDWMNTQIKNGNMSLDDSSGFLGLTLNMPVNGNNASPSNQEKVNFFELVQGGMQWARQRNDEAQLKTLQTTLSIMQRSL